MSGVGDEIEYQGHIWRVKKINKDGRLTLVQPGTRRTRTLTLADIMCSHEEEVDEEKRRCGTPTTLTPSLLPTCGRVPPNPLTPKCH